MKNDIFNSMGSEHTLDAGPHEIVEDSALGMGKRRNVGAYIVGLVIVLAASGFSYALYKQEQGKNKPPLGIEIAGDQSPSVQPTTNNTDVVVAAEVNPPVLAPQAEVKPAEPIQQVNQVVNPEPSIEPVPAAPSKPAIMNAVLTTQAKPALAINEEVADIAPQITPKKKQLRKPAIKQVAAKVEKFNDVEPMPIEEGITSESILIYSE